MDREIDLDRLLFIARDGARWALRLGGEALGEHSTLAEARSEALMLFAMGLPDGEVLGIVDHG